MRAVTYLQETGIDVCVCDTGKRVGLRCAGFIMGLRTIPDIRLYGDFETDNRCPIVALNIGDYDSSEVSDELFLTYGIATRPGAHCAPLMHEALGTVDNREQ